MFTKQQPVVGSTQVILSIWHNLRVLVATLPCAFFSVSLHDCVLRRPAQLAYMSWTMIGGITIKCCLSQDPVTKQPAVMVKKRSITRQKELERQLDQQQLALQRQSSSASHLLTHAVLHNLLLLTRSCY